MTPAEKQAYIDSIMGFKKETNMAYDTGKGYEDCATQPSSNVGAAIEREKITINKSEYDELRKSLTEWQTMSSLLGIARHNYNDAVPSPTDVFDAFKRGKEVLASAEARLAANLELYRKLCDEVEARAFGYMNERDAALEDLELLRAAMKKRKRK